jgi:carbon starvation protein
LSADAVSLVFADIFFEYRDGRLLLHAMPVIVGVLCVLAIAYRYYSAFLAARVAMLDNRRVTPAHRYNDGQNYDPTNRWVLFGHHFAAISGAGPLIGPVLAIQYGYMPGLLWLVTGVCLAGAVQDMLVLALSVRRGGKSLAEIARQELGRPATIVVSAAILFIVVIALAGLGFVVVKALGGEEVRLAAGTEVMLPTGGSLSEDPHKSSDADAVYRFPQGCSIRYRHDLAPSPRSESFAVAVPRTAGPLAPQREGVTLPAGTRQLVAGSSWGTFTIACTIPIALIVGWYMYRLRRGRVVEASIIGAVAVIGATVAGSWVPRSALEPYFSLSKDQTILALCVYGFVASVLPVWLLLCPRDYLSSFLKIGTIAILILGVILANPVLECPPVNPVFRGGGPTFQGGIFPFVFICIMCGAVSGFHALVASGTTPKMIDRESHIRAIGYGAMLMEGIVGVVALIAAASLDQRLYYDINVDLARAGTYQKDLDRLYHELGEGPEASDPLHATQVDAVQHLNLGQVEDLVGGEALRGRTGGAVTLAVGMAVIFTKALSWAAVPVAGVMKYWYHFAIMFEALFILTTIDAGTRIARFLLQEALGKVYPKFERTDWLPGAVLATFVVTAAWGVLIKTGSISTIWPMFGIANQLLAVVALSLVATALINTGRARFAWVAIAPMLFVLATTLSAGAEMVGRQFPAMIETGDKQLQAGQEAGNVLMEASGRQLVWSGMLSIALGVFVITCVLLLLLFAVSRWIAVLSGMAPARRPDSAPADVALGP